MAETLEAIKGGGGSIKVGTTGRIGSLMIRELDAIKTAPSVPAATKMPKPGKSPDEASSSSSSSNGSITNQKSLGIPHKTKGSGKNAHRVPMLGSDNVALDRTPTRQKADKGSYLVEVVDVKCGHGERRWKPIKNRLKKLHFSKLSESTI